KTLRCSIAPSGRRSPSCSAGCMHPSAWPPTVAPLLAVGLPSVTAWPMPERNVAADSDARTGRSPGRRVTVSCTTAPTTTAPTPRSSTPWIHPFPSRRGGTRAGDGVASLAATLVTPTAVREQPAAPPYESVAPGSGPVVGAVLAGPADFLAGDLTQTLRRGAEVQRFAELAARRDVLTPDESDELYRYRLRRLLTRIRQLERAGAGSDETAISEAVGDLQARLEELHGFETIRRQAGLFADHEVDLSADER